MQLLFSSTSLQLHTESFSPSFFDGEKEYSFSEIELKEYLANFPDLHINGTCYRLLNPSYYIWIRKQICQVVKLYKAGKLTTEQIAETRENWKIIHRYAVDNLNSKSIKNCLDDIKLQTQEDTCAYQIPIYDAKLDISSLKTNTENKQPNPYTQSKELCPNCNSLLSERTYKFGAITYQCFSCNDYVASMPTTSTIEDKYIDKFASTKPYCTIEYKTDIGQKCCTDTAFSSSGERSERSSPKKPSFSRFPSLSSLGEASELSDLSNLSWLQMLEILEFCQNDTRLKKDNFELYIKTVAYSGYKQGSSGSDKPNIENDVGLIKFLDLVRDVVKELIKQGYYTEQDKELVTSGFKVLG